MEGQRMSADRSETISEFFQAIRRRPKFTRAAQADPHWHTELDDLQGVIERLAAKDDPDVIELVDDLMRIIDRKSITLKQRLLAIGERLTELRNRRRPVN
jgi:hypothetical protein